MNEKYINSCLAIEAAKYLIQLYASTKYRCNRQKLQKLILFAHFARLLDNKSGLLDGEPVTASNIGLGIESVSAAYRTLNFNGIDTEGEIPAFTKRSNEDFTLDYRCDTELLADSIFDLKEMFMKFGAYSGIVLSAVTRELTLYPRNVDFSQEPEYTVTLTNEVVTEYIFELKREYESKNFNGVQIVQDTVIKALSKIDGEYF